MMFSKNYQEKISTFLDEKRGEMVDTLKSFISIPSVWESGDEKTPYGTNVAQVLKLSAYTAQDFGLSVSSYESKINLIDLSEKETKLAILTHLDVVPVNTDKWETPPFQGIVKENMIYGRGACDNKGPSIAALYAMYAVKRLGIPLKYNARLFHCGAEEVGMIDVKEYVRKNTMPEYVFTPDAAFPVANQERGRIVAKSKVDVEFSKIKKIESGTAANIVPGQATVLLQGIDAEEIESILKQGFPEVRYELSLCKGDVVLNLFGSSTHAAHPHEGDNALTRLLPILREIEPCEVLDNLCQCFPHGVFFGEGFSLKSTGTNVTITCMHYGNGMLTLEADCRVNVGVCAAEVAEGLKEHLCGQVDMNVREPHFVGETEPIVQSLQHVYKAVTGRDDPPYMLDSMTYAHCVENAVVFGGVFEGDGTCNAHGDNERYNIDTMVTAAKLIANAIVEICKE